MSDSITAKLDRLTRLVGTDEGFYVLALHSFVEYWLRYEKGYGDGPRFADLTWGFRNELLEARAGELIEGLSCLARLGSQHEQTNRVRHAFEELDAEESRAATHLFVQFCRLAGLEREPAVATLARALEAWRERRSPIEQAAVIRAMQAELERLRSHAALLVAQREDYGRLRAQLGDLQHELHARERELLEARAVADRRHQRMDELRRQCNALARERESLAGALARFAELERYMRYLGRLSVYTRTRQDYQRTIGELTPEQEEAVAGLRTRGSFLIRGGPGTGKSLVLIEGLRRAAAQGLLDFGSGESVVLITFTRTLVRYDRHIAEIMRLRLPLEIIGTADALFLNKLKAACGEVAYDFDLLQRWFTEERTPRFLSPAEAAAEIESFLFANAVTRAEYIDEIVPRHGMRRRLTRGQREEVWRVREELCAWMEANRVYTREYGRMKLLQHLRDHPRGSSGDGLRDIAALYLDEAQDMTAAALMALRELTRGGMVMAGDADQSLYSTGSPFARAGLDLRGSTRVLRTNFRATTQIHALAEAFRARSSHLVWESPTEPAAFREGPAPELYRSADPAALMDLLAGKAAMFVRDLGYAPENLCVLAPHKQDLPPLAARLAAAGLETADIKDESFSFADTGRVRLSTLHSAKGLDIPVVLAWLPCLPRRPLFDEEQTDRLMRNLVYVTITRAMDNLNVFLLDGNPLDPVLADLAAVFS